MNLNWHKMPEKLFEMVNAKDKNGKTPLNYAIDRHSEGHIKVLLSFSVDVNQEILLYAKENLPEYLIKLLTTNESQ